MTTPRIDPKQLEIDLENAGFPKQWAKKAFVDLKNHKNWASSAVACDLALKKHGLACVFGGPRTGKTQIGVTIGKTRLHEGFSAAYATLSKFILDFEVRDKFWDTIADTYWNPGLLVLDNCHLIHNTAMHQSWIDALIQRRTDETQKQTIFIFEAHAKSLPTYLSTGLAGKLAASGAYIHCDWPAFL